MKIFMTIMLSFAAAGLMAQEGNLPYREIAKHPDSYSAGAVASRMVDGLGFRFYWATEGLRTADLTYKPGEDSRSSLETIEHIYSMSFVIMNAASGKPNARGQDKKGTYEEMRRTT